LWALFDQFNEIQEARDSLAFHGSLRGHDQIEWLHFPLCIYDYQLVPLRYDLY
jgi:hypothetical protein